MNREKTTVTKLLFTTKNTARFFFLPFFSYSATSESRGPSTLRHSLHSPQHPSTSGERCTMALPWLSGHRSPLSSTTSHSPARFGGADG